MTPTPNIKERPVQTRLTEAFGIRYPLVCAPMALVTGGRLAAAVAGWWAGIVGGGYAGVLGGEPDLSSFDRRARRSSRLHHMGSERAFMPSVREPFPSCVFLSFGDAKPFAAGRRGGAIDLPGAEPEDVDRA